MDKKAIDTLNQEIYYKAKCIEHLVYNDDDPKATEFIKNKLDEINTLLDIRTKIMK